MTSIIGLIGRHAPHAVAKHARKHGWVDLKLGYELMRDRRVSVLTKLAALATGVTFTAILVALEVPLEVLVGGLLPLLGLFLDFTFDGLEFVVLPVVVAGVAIRWFAPKQIVESVRARLSAAH